MKAYAVIIHLSFMPCCTPSQAGCTKRHAAAQVGCSAAYLAVMTTIHKLTAPDHMVSSQSQALLQSQPVITHKLLGQTQDLLPQTWGEAGSKGQRV